MRKLSFLSLFALVFVMFNACNASKSATTSTTSSAPKAEEKKAATASNATFVGTWATSVSGTPAGDVNFDLTFEQADGKYKGFLMGEGVRTDLTDVKVEGNKATVNFYSSQFGVDVYFTATLNETGDAISGYVMDSFKMSGKRK